MNKSTQGDQGLSNFDVKNEKLNRDLKKYEASTGTNRDRRGRDLVKTSLEFINFMNEPALDGAHVHPALRALVVDAIKDYATGGSFDLSVGGKVTKTKNGRPNKVRRNDAIRLSVACNIDDGSDVLAAATLTSEQLAIGEVDGLPVVTLTPAAVRSIWYANPLTLLTAQETTDEETAPPLIRARNFEELKSICKDRSDAYDKLSPAVLKVRAGLSNLNEQGLRKFEHAIRAIADGVEPNVAFQYDKAHQPVKIIL